MISPRFSVVGHILRVGSSAGSQVLASIGSLILSLIVAQRVSAVDYGVFAIIFATSALTVGVVRSLTSEVVMFSDPRTSASAQRRLLSNATSASVLLSFGAGAVIALIGVALGASGAPLLVLAAAIPALTGQDHMRFSLIWQRKSTSALFLDLANVVALTIALITVGADNLETLLWVWAACSYATWIAGLALLRVAVTPRRARDWINAEWRAGRFFLGDFLATNVLSIGSVYLISLFASVSDAGAVRAAQTLLTPILLITRGATIALSPEVRRLADRGSNRRLIQVGAGFSLATILAAGLAVVIVLVVPREAVESLLGESSTGALAVFPYAAVATAMLGVAMGPGLVLRAIGRVNRAFRSKVITLPLAGIAVVAGTVLGGGAGSQLGLALGETLRGALNWSEVASWKKKRTKE